MLMYQQNSNELSDGIIGSNMNKLVFLSIFLSFMALSHTSTNETSRVKSNQNLIYIAEDYFYFYAGENGLESRSIRLPVVMRVNVQSELALSNCVKDEFTESLVMCEYEPKSILGSNETTNYKSLLFRFPGILIERRVGKDYADQSFQKNRYVVIRP
ncbi:hypothetical protein [Vibrio owensii]|uniref:hypothetical protein n=1 Tax=Vibrio harveyi group TaxID=717610 RepID=UPI003CC5568E